MILYILYNEPFRYCNYLNKFLTILILKTKLFNKNLILLKFVFVFNKNVIKQIYCLFKI